VLAPTVPTSTFTAPFWVANVVNLLCLTGASTFVILPVYLERHGLHRWEIGLVAAAFSLVSVFARPWVGARLDRQGRRRSFVRGAAFLGLLALAYLAAPPSLASMALLRGLQGLGMAFYFTAIWTWIADFAPENRRGEVMGFFGISGLVSGAAGPVLAEAVLEGGGFHSVFAGAGLLALVAALLSRRLEDRMPPVATQPPRACEFWQLSRSSDLVGTTLGSMAFGAASGTLLAFAAPFVALSGHAGVGIFFTLYNVASVSVRVFAGRMADRLGPQRIVAPALACQALGLAVFSQIQAEGWPGLWLLGTAALLGGTGHGLIYPALSSLAVQRVGASRRGMGVSLFTAAVELGACLGAAAAGVLAHLTGYPQTFLALAAVTALAAGIHPGLEARQTRGLEGLSPGTPVDPPPSCAGPARASGPVDL